MVTGSCLPSVESGMQMLRVRMSVIFMACSPCDSSLTRRTDRAAASSRSIPTDRVNNGTESPNEFALIFWFLRLRRESRFQGLRAQPSARSRMRGPSKRIANASSSVKVSEKEIRSVFTRVFRFEISRGIVLRIPAESRNDFSARIARPSVSTYSTKERIFLMTSLG